MRTEVLQNLSSRHRGIISLWLSGQVAFNVRVKVLIEDQKNKSTEVDFNESEDSSFFSTVPNRLIVNPKILSNRDCWWLVRFKDHSETEVSYIK